MVGTPGFLADRIMAAGYRTRVVRHEAAGPGLVRLVLGCEEFRTATTEPGDSTAFRTGRTEFRHYTPARLDTAAGELEIIVQRHGSGPGEALIESWSVGDEVGLCRWGSVKSFRWTDGDGPLVVIGDGTVVSLAMAFADRATATGRDLLVLLEVGADDVAAAERLVPGAHVVAAGSEPGVAIDAWLREHRDLLDPGATAFLAGHGQSIQRQRSFLRDELGFDRRSVRTQPYWATGKTGL